MLLFQGPDVPKSPLMKTTKTAAYLSESVQTNVKQGHIICVCSYAAVAANTSALFAFVNKPVLAAKRNVKSAMSPILRSSELTLYRVRIAPNSNSAARTVLKYATKDAILRPDA